MMALAFWFLELSPNEIHDGGRGGLGGPCMKRFKTVPALRLI